MANFPTTTEELDEYISDYMDAHIADRITGITSEAISNAVNSYLQNYGAAIEDNGSNGDVPLIADSDLDPLNTTIPLAELSGGVPVRYVQARIRALAIVAASLISGGDVPLSVIEQTEDDVTISPNCLNLWSSALSSLSVSFDSGESGTLSEYMMQFSVSGSSFSLSFADDVTWLDGDEPEFEDGWTYQISVVNGLAVYGGWEAATS